METSTLACPRCGAAAPASARFCTSCGESLAAGPAPAAASPFACQGCGGDGATLPASQVYCPVCRWLRPLGPDYDLPVDAFMWRFDAEAMNVLRSIGPLNAAAHALSEKVGRPWFEAQVNGLRLSESQLPDVFALAIRAARIVGLPYLPEIYVSGEHMWDAVTMGSNSSAFIALGSVLTMLRGEDLLYVLGREMGHAKAGHALWRTVVNLMTGRQPANRSLMSDGVLSFLSPAKLIESGINAPLMAWQRQAEITADRAGLLVVGKIDVVRRVTLQTTLHSFPLLQRINTEAWIEQEDESDDTATQVAEFAATSMPYAARRLKLLREFAASEELAAWRKVIDYWAPPVAPAPAPVATGQPLGQPNEIAPPPAPAQPPPDSVRLTCMVCQTPMRVPKSILQGPGPVNVRCPNPACGKVLAITPRKPPPGPAAP